MKSIWMFKPQPGYNCNQVIKNSAVYNLIGSSKMSYLKSDYLIKNATIFDMIVSSTHKTKCCIALLKYLDSFYANTNKYLFW